MKKLTLALSSAFLMAALFASCSKTPVTPPAGTIGTSGGGTGTGTGTGTTTGTGGTGTTTGTGGTTTTASPKVGYRLKATDLTSAMRTTAGASITWTSATVSPKSIKFEAKKGTSEIEYTTVTSGTVDLMAPMSAYFGGFSIPSGTYNEIELKVQLGASLGAALELTGQFSNSSGTTPVKVLINESVLLKTEAHGVTVTDSDSLIAITTFNLSAIASGITEGMVTAGTLTSGTLVISSGSNTSLYNLILSNLKNRDHHYELERHHH